MWRLQKTLSFTATGTIILCRVDCPLDAAVSQAVSPMCRGSVAASEPARLVQAPAHAAPDQGGAQGSCAPDKEAQRGPARERAAPVSDS
ncbi:hypothetical protein NDU88_004276 [Pleurodeles waltl]|uniref:Uncharacterized protein n=1 Tax=Pleurodeles waltl TaxID=8319 RepID=A0AAV7SID1_PLEWA|nr:hypothetical protein NDU88_004276 [Pleurodeles waltl]